MFLTSLTLANSEKRGKNNMRMQRASRSGTQADTVIRQCISTQPNLAIILCLLLSEYLRINITPAPPPTVIIIYVRIQIEIKYLYI